MNNTKGIFCLEGLWDSDLKIHSTISPILELLRVKEKIDYIYKDVATEEEFEFYLNKWKQKKYKKYPILYLATHGEENSIFLGNRKYSLDRLSEYLTGSCKNRIIVFGSCSTMKVRKHTLKKFLQKTNALAICGYKIDVDWMVSTAFELLLLNTMQDNQLRLCQT